MSLEPPQLDRALAFIDRFLSRPKEAPNRRSVNILLYGGEPLLPAFKSRLELVLSKIAQRGYKASFSTNGYFLLEHLDLLSRYRKNIDYIQITLDGPKTIHDKRRVLWSGQGTFDRITAGITALLKVRGDFAVNVRMNLDRENVGLIRPLARFIARKKWSRNPNFHFSMVPVENRRGLKRNLSRLITYDKLLKYILPNASGKNKAEAAELLYGLSGYKVLKNVIHSLALALSNPAKQRFIPRVTYCAANFLRMFVFHPDGLIYPCGEIAGEKKFAIGSYSPKTRFFKKNVRIWRDRTILRMGKCRQCPIATFCGGGCALAALTNNGSIDSPCCDNALEVLEKFFQYLKQLYAQPR
jgi:uncharacterized protein